MFPTESPTVIVVIPPPKDKEVRIVAGEKSRVSKRRFPGSNGHLIVHIES